MRRIVAVLSLLTVLTGCTTGGSDQSDVTSAAAPPAGTAEQADRTGPDVTAAVANAQPLPRSVVRTAELHVRVEDAGRAADRAEDLVRAAGGEVATEDLNLSSELPTATLLLLVPAAKLPAILDALAKLGDEQLRRLGSDDVTDQIVDLDSRIATQRASVARVRDLLGRATGLSEVVTLEAELSKRASDLGSIQARLRALSGQVALSRVSLRLETGAPVAAAAADVGFTSGLRSGWHAFLATARVVGATVGAVLPFLPVLLVGAWITWRWRRRAAGISAA